ncbi:MAG: phospholipid/glycerol acyltransferase [Verrucomicrobiales bacterium]|nr:phospholipid/glycerol acyltransferase [Verrucomicrobiales bacterium]
MNPVYRICHSLTWGVARAALNFRVIHPENLIEDGPALICANHVSFFDPPLISICFEKEIHFLARHTLYSNPVARWLFPRLNVTPIDQDRAGMSGLKTMVRVLNGGHRVLIFPEGSRSPDGKLQPAAGGAGLITAKSRAPVIPIRLFGAYEALPIGSGRPRFVTVTAVIGKPLRFSEAEFPSGREGYQRISDAIMEAIAALRCPLDRLPEPAT